MDQLVFESQVFEEIKHDTNESRTSSILLSRKFYSMKDFFQGTKSVEKKIFILRIQDNDKAPTKDDENNHFDTQSFESPSDQDSLKNDLQERYVQIKMQIL